MIIAKIGISLAGESSGSGGSGDGGVKVINSGDKKFVPDNAGDVTLGSAAGMDVQAFSTDLTDGAVLQNGSWGLGALVDTPMTMATGFMTYKTAAAEVPGAGAGYTISAGINKRIQHFVTSTGVIYDRVSTSATIKDASTEWIQYVSGISEITAGSSGTVYKASGNNITLANSVSHSVVNDTSDTTGKRLLTNEGWLGMGISTPTKGSSAGFNFNTDNIRQSQTKTIEKLKVVNDPIPANDSQYYYMTCICVKVYTSNINTAYDLTLDISLEGSNLSYRVSRTWDKVKGDVVLSCDRIGGTQVYPIPVSVI